MSRLNYRTAFIACRKHRIELNLLVDHRPEVFVQNIGIFLDQVDEVDYINLFLTNIGFVFSSSSVPIL